MLIKSLFMGSGRDSHSVEQEKLHFYSSLEQALAGRSQISMSFSRSAQKHKNHRKPKHTGARRHQKKARPTGNTRKPQKKAGAPAGAPRKGPATHWGSRPPSRTVADWSRTGRGLSRTGRGLVADCRGLVADWSRTVADWSRTGRGHSAPLTPNRAATAGKRRNGPFRGENRGRVPRNCALSFRGEFVVSVPTWRRTWRSAALR
jgi:hypothetical protein